MTGDFTLTLPIMLTVGIATALSRGMSYATIYTGKLLRRGQDIDRATPWRALSWLTAADTMRALPTPQQRSPIPGRTVFESETVADIVHQLDEAGPDGLAVLSEDGQQVRGRVTAESVIRAIRAELLTHRPSPRSEPTRSPRISGASRPPRPRSSRRPG